MKQAKRLIVVVIGFTIPVIGVAMIVLPRLAVVVIPIGLAILAKRILTTVQERINRMRKGN